MPFLGRWEVDDLLVFPANTHSPSTGAATDADSVPSYRVYEDETGTPILTGSMALLDSANTAGFYSEQITLSAANGFEVGKCYTVYVSATVGGITSTMAHTFQVEATLATASALATVQADTDDIQTRLPAALVSGRIDASAGAIAANAITTASINDGAFTAAKFASGALDAVWSVASRTLTAFGFSVTASTVSDKTGYSLSGAGVQAIWDALTSALTTVGSIGKRISDNLDVVLSTRLATSGYTAPPTVVQVRTEMDSNSTKLANLDATVSSRATPAQVNTEADTALADVGLTTTITGRIDAAISTRLATAGYTAPDNADILLIKAKTDNLPANTTTTLATLQTSVDDVPTNAELTTALGTADDATFAAIAALNNLSAAGVRTAIGLASANLDTQLDALPTNAELATSQAAADDATLAAIAALTIPTANTIADAVLSRGVSNVEDTADTTSLAALILATFESSASGTTWTVRKTAGGTFVVKTLTLDDTADPVVGVN